MESSGMRVLWQPPTYNPPVELWAVLTQTAQQIPSNSIKAIKTAIILDRDYIVAAETTQIEVVVQT